MANDAAAGTWWPVGAAYLAREILERAVFGEGVPVRRDTVANVILRRLVLEGSAERVPAPATDLSAMRSDQPHHLGEWLNSRPR